MVEQVGPAVTWFKPGDEVYGYCRRHDLEYGTYAELVTVPEGYLAHVPRALRLRRGGRAAARGPDRPPGLERLGVRAGEVLFVSGGVGRRGPLRRPARPRARRQAWSPPACEANYDFLRELGAEPVDYDAPDVADQRPRAQHRRRRGRGARPVRRASREQAFACCAPAAASSRSPPPPGEREQSTPATCSCAPLATTSGRANLVNEGALCPRSPGLPARARGGRARAARGRSRARQARAHDFLSTGVASAGCAGLPHVPGSGDLSGGLMSTPHA